MLRLLPFLLLPLLAGCVAPIGAVHSSPQQALDQIQGRTSSLRELSGYTRSILRRHDQEARFKNQGQPATIEEVRRIIHEHLAAANIADGSEKER